MTIYKKKWFISQVLQKWARTLHSQTPSDFARILFPRLVHKNGARGRRQNVCNTRKILRPLFFFFFLFYYCLFISMRRSWGTPERGRHWVGGDRFVAIVYKLEQTGPPVTNHFLIKCRCQNPLTHSVRVENTNFQLSKIVQIN